MKRILTVPFLSLLFATFCLGAVDGREWVMMKSGDFFDVRYKVTVEPTLVHFNVNKDDAGNNRGAWYWSAPAGRAVKKVSFKWRYNGDPKQFGVVAFGGPRHEWNLDRHPILWTAEVIAGQNSGRQTLTFNPGDRQTGIGFGFTAKGAIYKDWQAEFSEISIETTQVQPTATPESYVTVKNGHFSRYGKRLKLWGVNFCASVKQDYPDLPLCFDRIADAGFDGVRHNLFCPNFIDPKVNNTFTCPRDYRDPSKPSELDKIDYTLYLAGQRGMIFWMQFDRAWSNFKPGDYDVLPDDGTRSEWEEMIKQLGPGMLVYIDERSEKAHQEHARSVLEHYNPYTGYRYADDPVIGLWETFNENSFVETILNSGFKDVPAAAKRVNARWNAWLTKKYGTTQKLAQAWGSLLPGESLEAKNIGYAPLLGGVKAYKQAGYSPEFEVTDGSGVQKYPYARGEDVIRFACYLYMSHTERFSKFVKSVGKPKIGISVVPICPSGRYGQNIPSYYAATVTDYYAVGNYGFACRPWEVSKSSPFYPWMIRLNMHPSIEHPLDMIRPANKPYIYYETNDYRPNPYGVEYPIRMAVSLVQQDADGAFWFYWDDGGYQPKFHMEADYLTARLPMPDVNYPNAGLVLGNDEVMLAAIKAAGTIFRSSNLSGSKSPKTYRIGKDILLNLSQCNIGALDCAAKLRHHAWREGIQIEYSEDKPSILPKDAVGWTDKFVQTGPYIQFDWSSGSGFVRIDAPTVKAHVGFNRQQVRLGDTTISEVNQPFTSIILVSEDGLPLERSKSVLVTMVAKSTNTGFRLDPAKMKRMWSEGLAEAVVEPGVSPVIVDRVSAKVVAPWIKGMTVEKFNFARQCYEKGSIDQALVVKETEPLFYARLTRK